MDVALVIFPGDAELDGTLRLDEAVHNALFDQLRPGVAHRGQRGENLTGGLVEFRLVRVPLDDPLHKSV